MTTEAKTVTRTVAFHLEEPTARKKAKLEKVIEQAKEVKRIAANRILSVPHERWQYARPANSTWYAWVKDIDADLPTNTAGENIQKVREAFASWRANGYPGDRPEFHAPECAYRHHQPKYDKNGDRFYLSLQTGAGYGTREYIPLKDGEYVRQYLSELAQKEANTGRGTLLRHTNGYTFYQTIKRERKIEQDIETAIGVDIGFVNFATAGAVDSDGKCGANLWNGGKHKDKIMEYKRRKKQAQNDGRVDELGREERNYIDDMCHTTARELIEWTKEYDRPKIVLEELDAFQQDFRNSDGVTPRVIHAWPVGKLQRFIEYKATDAGIPVEYVDSQYTSMTCNECGHTDEQNRSNSHFECGACGYQVNADVNAAMNLARGGSQ